MINDIIDRDFKEINLMRMLSGSSTIKKKQKRCTECRNTFETTSYDIQCAKCKKEIRDYYEKRDQWNSNLSKINSN